MKKYNYTPCLMGSIFLLFVFFNVEKSHAQNDCKQNLEIAKNKYAAGKINEIPFLLENCLKKNRLNKSNRSDAYKLLTLTYLYYNEKGKAIRFMSRFIALNPDYKINHKIDPAEFINLFNSFKKGAIFFWGVKAGLNRSQISLIDEQSLGNTATGNTSFKGLFGFSIGPEINVKLINNLNLSTALMFSQRGFTRSESLFQENFMSISSTETAYLLDIPISFKYLFKGRKRQFYLNLGAYGSVPLKNSLTVKRTDILGEVKGDNIESPSFDVAKDRKNMRYGALGGLGILFKNKNNQSLIGIEFNYYMGLNNIINPENRYQETDRILKYGYIDKDVSENFFGFTLSYLIPKYQPKFKKAKLKIKKGRRKASKN